MRSHLSHRGQKTDEDSTEEYHDGDPSDIFILDTDEVSVFNADSTVLEALISVVSNEHHRTRRRWREDQIDHHS